MRVFISAVVSFLAVVPVIADETERRVTATGQAEVRVAPDEVLLTLGVESFELELEEAKSDNDTKVSAVIEAAKRAGVSPEHIKTDFLVIEPRYEDHWKKRTFLGYVVRKSIVLTSRDVHAFEDLLSNALNAGANYVHGIDFRTTELRKHRDQARDLAIVAAREKAEALAGRLGQTIGRPITIQEGHTGWWSTYGSWWGSRGSAGGVQNVIQSAGPSGGAGDGPTSPGQIAITANVTVAFELLDEEP